MDYTVRDISNAVMITSLDTIIQQESCKLKMDKNTGLIAKKSKMLKIQPIKENRTIVKQTNPIFKGSKSYFPIVSNSFDHAGEIERSENTLTKSPGYITTNNYNNSIDTKYNQELLKKKKTKQKHNEFNNYDILLNNQNNANVFSPNIKVRRNVRFGEYSPLHPANQGDSKSFLGFGEYDEKRKQLLELQKKEYIEYLSKAKQEKNSLDLPKLPAYSCEEAFKTAMDGNNSEQIKLSMAGMHKQEDLKPVPFVDGLESCASNENQLKELNRSKQDLYRFELSKQIEEKKKLEFERKQREKMEDEAIERAARAQEDKIKKELEKESEKRMLAQLQKQLQQEKLKNEIIQKQKDLESKARNESEEKISQQVSKHLSSRHESFEDDEEEFHCPPDSTFDNVPLPTSRVRVPRKIVYDEEAESKTTRDVSCNTDSFKNPCMNQTFSPPVMRKQLEKGHVSFAREPYMKRNEYNSTALLPVTKSMIIDSPHTLALAGLDDGNKNDTICEAVEPTEAYKNQVSKKEIFESNQKLFTDKHLLSNLGNIRKQLDIEHQRLKQQVRKSQ